MSARPPARLNRWELACLLLLAIGFLIRFPIKFWLQPPFLMDFNVYRFAAELIRTGQGHELYRLAYHEDMYFKYGPLWAQVWAFFAYLPTHHGAILWSMLNVVWLIFTLWCANRAIALAGWRVVALAPAAAIFLFVRPLTEEFSNGQANLWWGGLTILFVYWELKERPWLAALALALSISLKLTSIMFVIYLTLTGRWRSGIRTLCWLALILGLGAVVVDPSHSPLLPLIAWFRLLAATSPEQAFQIGDQSLLALLARFFTADGYGLHLLALPRSAVVALAWLIDAALFAMIALPCSWRTPRSARQLIIDAALLMILMVLASPAGWVPTYTVLLFPCMLGLTLLVQPLRPHYQVDWVSVALGSAVGGLSLLLHSKVWKAFGVFHWRSESYVFLVFMILPWCALALFALLWRQRQLLAHSQRTPFV